MRLLFLATFLTLTSAAFSQTIKFKISGLPDTTVNLVRYFGKGLYYADTANVKKGVVEFDGSKQDAGILALFMPGEQLLEFIYNDEDIYIESTAKNPMPNAKVKKSEENKIFLEYVSFIGKERAQIDVMRKELETTDKVSNRHEILTKQIKDKNQGVIDYQKNIVKEHPEFLVAKMINMSMDVDIPEAPKDENGVVLDSNFRFNYFKSHYWDNVDLKDDRLVRSTIYHTKLQNYFEKTMVQHWDTIIKYAIEFCDQLPEGSDMLQYSVSWITSNYERSKIMGMDKVFVRMGQRYYCGKDADRPMKAHWMPENKLDELCNKVDIDEHLVMGIVPPNINLPDSTNKQWHNFYDIDAEYTIIYFWDPECGHCKKITPKLQKLYAEKLRDRKVEIYAVGKAVGEDFEKWKKFIRKNNLEFINVAMTDSLYTAAKKDARSVILKHNTTLEALNYQTTFDVFMTPKVFILDKDKKIIGKGLNLSQLEEYLDRLQGVPEAEKLFPVEEQPKDEEIH